MKALLLTLILILANCATSPTGRRQLTLLPSGQLNQMGEQAFDQMKGQGKISSNRAQNQYVQCITIRLLEQMGERPTEWEMVVFSDDSPNAFALPGKKMGMHTGMINLAQNQHQLAAVIGHEIGHVLADHGNERVSQGMVAQVGLVAADMVLGRETVTDQLILAGLGIGAQFGVLMPFSRRHETEADRLGLEYMAKAGFDPREAPKLWEVMNEKAGGASPPEFLSTHPSPRSRIKDLSSRVPNYMPIYETVSDKPQCRI